MQVDKRRIRVPRACVLLLQIMMSSTYNRSKIVTELLRYTNREESIFLVLKLSERRVLLKRMKGVCCIRPPLLVSIENPLWLGIHMLALHQIWNDLGCAADMV